METTRRRTHRGRLSGITPIPGSPPDRRDWWREAGRVRELVPQPSASAACRDLVEGRRDHRLPRAARAGYGAHRNTLRRQVRRAFSTRSRTTSASATSGSWTSLWIRRPLDNASPNRGVAARELPGRGPGRMDGAGNHEVDPRQGDVARRRPTPGAGQSFARETAQPSGFARSDPASNRMPPAGVELAHAV
jgi:hypothetical protein